MPNKIKSIKKTRAIKNHDGWSETTIKTALKKPLEQDIQGEELTRICIDFFGETGWKVRVSELMRVDSRTVRVWASGKIPGNMAAELFRRMNIKDSRFEGSELKWPRDDWFITEGEEERLYIIKLKAPRFQARVLFAGGDEEIDKDTVDMITGAVYLDDGIIICEVHWFDIAPPLKIQSQQLEEAAERAWAWWNDDSKIDDED